MQLPLEDRYLHDPRAICCSQLAVLLAGRTAEEIAFGDISTGAQNDLQRATDIARAMVTEFGMSEALGAVNYNGHKRTAFLDTAVHAGARQLLGGHRAEDRRGSEADLGEATRRHAQVLRERRAMLDELSERLLEKWKWSKRTSSRQSWGPFRRKIRMPCRAEIPARRPRTRGFLMPTRTEAESFEDILEHLRSTRGFDFTRLQARQPRCAASASAWTTVGVRDLRATTSTTWRSTPRSSARSSTRSSSTSRRSSATRAAWDHLRDEVLPRCSPQGRRRADPGVERRAARRARRRTRWPWCWPRRSASTRSASGSRSTPPTSTTRRWPRPAPGDLHRPGAARASRRTLLERYFEPRRRRYVVPQRTCGASVIFGRHDLIQDAPISRIDLLALPQHADVLQRRDAGADPRPLPLRAQRRTAACSSARRRCCSPTRRCSTPVDLKRRLFRKVDRPDGHRGCRLGADADARRRDGDADLDDRAARRRASSAAPRRADRGRRRRRARRWPTGRPGALFGLAAARHRPPAPGPRDLVPAGGAALADRRRPRTSAGRSRSRERRLAGAPATTRHLDIAGRAARSTPARRLLGVAHHLPRRHPPPPAPGRARAHPSRELETAYEELQSTNEELETTNEELQSTIEELETTNEELQSTNEELETMNEELQSTNEELQTINDEMRSRSDASSTTINAFLEIGPQQPQPGGRRPRCRLSGQGLEPRRQGAVGADEPTKPSA